MRKSARKEHAITLFFKYLWVIMIVPKYIQLALILFLSIRCILESRKAKKFDGTTGLFLLFFAIYFVSVLVNMLGSFSSERLLATVNTLFIWLIGIIMYWKARTGVVDYEAIKKYMFRNMIILILLGFLMLIMQKIGITPIAIFQKTLYRGDWLNGGEKILRFRGYMDYPNLCCLFYVLCIPFYMETIKRKNNLFAVIAMSISVIPVLLTESRIGLFSAALLIIINILSILKSRKTKMVFIFLSIIVGSLVMIAKGDILAAKTWDVITSRENSTSTRTNLYEESIDAAVKDNILIGKGIKDKETGSAIPLGSHSTYIGVFYKTGIIGSVVFTVALVSLMRALLTVSKNHKNILNIFMPFVIFLAMLALEDLDGADWLIITFFLVCGLYSNGNYMNRIGVENETVCL